ncbi:MAG: YggS family pyridoxal phosphate-dependent enzyme [Ruminococcaceae bacterium]|nr:YggS family pyridoxal phosphate-dependent enzyme [Oscillospiraceae bacterium]
MSITENVIRIREEIRKAAIAAGRDPASIRLCAATKMNGTPAIREAIAAGVTCCGENRVQELTQKLSENAYEGADIHFIGHLQTNKVKQVVGKVSLIHSIDSLHLLEAVNKEALRQGIQQDILLEINIGDEESKSGFTPEELFTILDTATHFPGIFIRGLMAIPPICQNPGDNDKFFQKMYQLSVDITAKKYDNVCSTVLSMGMSADYREAIACGSTMVRIGTDIFGARNYAAKQPQG